ncbi:dihydroorotate dehydrogenase [Paenibacillus hunanensis]|uniref:Dihydroorotate dehydrogenase n=1 Tax=Paenibacillus hunanensis TaxID=539262 RepID=A0ABU1IXF2_9BACL|nr:dihydroorotate dehydrogenase [Paenibacillus hunanensis]MDR6243933.1 dihydroorotate dehydrogenase (NAD+) catalytic subunit [Paenibacillus hunanensis]GGJ15854.1 dihydroorotate dehydrogenase B (NAD(+)), catalytic subunit [Paenibacillus hunanensis]
MSLLTCNIGGISLRNPIIMASGTFGFGREYAQQYDVSVLGGICGKGLTLEPRAGNAGCRVQETAAGMLNSVGLENPGIAAFLADELDEMAALGPCVIANLGGANEDEYVKGARQLTADYHRRQRAGRRGVEMIELNISCPNVKQGGIQFGVDTAMARPIVRAVRAATDLPLMVKLSPNAQQIVEMALMCEQEGADAVSLVNTFSAMKIDIQRRRSYFDNGYAGLSGPAIKPIALRMVHQVAHAVQIPVVGMGGISSVEDAIEFIMAGAEAVQVGTHNFVNIRAGKMLVEGLEQWMRAQGIASLAEIRGIV